MSTFSRLPIAFHETFPLKRVAIAQVTEVLSNIADENVLKSKSKREDVLREKSSLGTNYVKSMPNYARGVGLLTATYTLTDLGMYTLHYDPVFDQINTQWLLHYHMSAPQGPGPEFWNKFVTRWFRTGNKFTKAELRVELQEYFWRSKGKQASDSTLDGALRAFVDTYASIDCLGKLGILTGSSKDFKVNSPIHPSAWAFAYALIDYWEGYCSGRISVNLDDLTNEGSLASLFLMDNATVNRILNELQLAGFVEVYRSAQPYQLLLLSHDKSLALRKLYGAD